MAQFPFTFPDSMKEKVKQIAEQRKCSIAQVIRDAINNYIKNYDYRK